MTTNMRTRITFAAAAAGVLLGLGAGPAAADSRGTATPSTERAKVECQAVSSNQSICKITLWDREYVVLCDKEAQTCTPGA